MDRFRLPPQIFRLVLLTLGIVIAYLIARSLLTPASYGQYGSFRGLALEEAAERPPVYAGRQACDECHAEIFQQVASHEHKTVSCESCHGPGKAHVDGPEEKLLILGDSLCLRCHEAKVGRPAWLKQIDVKEHFRGDRCIGCHVPHQPTEMP